MRRPSSLYRGEFGGHSSSTEMAEINIIPLVDIMLVLLIIFMVAAPLSISGISVELPTSRAPGTALDETRIIISINAQGEIYFDHSHLAPQDLIPKLEAIFATRVKKELFIRADRRVAYSAVIDAMSAAKIAGISRISMLTTPPGTLAHPPAAMR